MALQVGTEHGHLELVSEACVLLRWLRYWVGGAGWVSTRAGDRFLADELWERVEPLVPPRCSAVNGRTGVFRVPDRQAFGGIVFVLLTGILWMKLSPELGFGSGITCWRRLQCWAEAGGVGPAEAGGP